MSQRADFYQIHLDRVSRSFAFCIEQLRDPLREWVGLSYLLCRVVDTIEDAAWTEPAERSEAFRRFDRALAGDADALAGLTVPGDVPEAERVLLDAAPGLMHDFHALEPSVRSLLEPLIRSMSLGMQHFARTKPLRLKSLNEVNQYCFFVAGVVGELLAGLLSRVESAFTLDQNTLLRAHHFGQFLQKVNVLKDQVDDEASGRHLVPSRDAVEASAAENASAAFDFLLAVPPTQVEFRRFCGWSLFLGLEALAVARRSRAEGRVLKVARERATELLGEVEAALGDDHSLSTIYHRLTQRLGWTGGRGGAEGAAPAWFRALYHGPLDAAGLRALGL